MKRNAFRASAVALAALMLIPNADAKKWEFFKPLSAETMANLVADKDTYKDSGETNWAEWYGLDYGETGDNAGKIPQSWTNVAKWEGDLIGTPICANGEPIKELEGIVFPNNTGWSKGADFRIGVQTETLRPIFGFGDTYSRFRFCRANMSMQLPEMPAGSEVTINYSSSAPSDKGGGRYIKSDDCEIISGAPDAYKDLTIYQVVFKVLPKEGQDLVAPIFTATNGVDIYWIDAPAVAGGQTVEEARPIAFITNSELSGNFDEAQTALEAAADRVELTVIESTDASSLEALQAFDAVVVSPFVGASDAIVPTLKSAIAYEPIVNLNASLLEAWGLGTLGTTDAAAAKVSEAYATGDLFAEVVLEDGMVTLLADGTLPALQLGDYFAKDQVIATAGDATVMHQHNATRNTYLGLPYTAESAIDADSYYTLVVNAAVFAAQTKTEVGKAAKPNIAQTKGDQVTTVKITAAPGAVIYYTIDGNDPTLSSPVYSEPFDLKEAATVKAFCTLDGYNPSDIASADVTIAKQAAEPKFTFAKEDKFTTVSISCASENTKVYYSFLENQNVAETSLYTEPIVLTEPTYIYAFATGDDYVQSPLAKEYVGIQGIDATNIRLDEIAHFNANQTDWVTNVLEYNWDGSEIADFHSGSTYYYWYDNTEATKNGKVNAWNYYDIENQIGEDEEGNPIYAADPKAVRWAISTTDEDWKIFSQGQVMIAEANGPTGIVGNGAAGYYADRAEDLIGGVPSKCNLQFGGKKDGEPYTGTLETTKAYKAPFDIVAYAGGQSSSVMNVEISADGKEWEKAGELNKVNNACSDSKWRYFTRTRLSVEKEGDYYVRLAHVGGGSAVRVFDVILYNHGEESAKYEDPNGVEAATVAAEVIATEVYDINGARLAEPKPGINIIRMTLSDGSVKVQKVIRK